MSDIVEVVCPFCGELLELVIEEDLRGVMIQDCEICCNPCEVTVTRDEWGDPDVRIERAD